MFDPGGIVGDTLQKQQKNKCLRINFSLIPTTSWCEKYIH